MSDTSSPDISAIRAALYRDLVEKKIFAKATNRSLRTIDRLIAQGLPTVKTPEGDMISPAMAHDWLMSSRVKSRDRGARGRGRPQKASRRPTGEAR